MEVTHSRVTIVLSRPDLLMRMLRIIYEDMLRGIPTMDSVRTSCVEDWMRLPSEAVIQAAHECNSLIDDTKLFVLRKAVQVQMSA